ncbi:MAG: hypothetical protein A3J81_03805 [Nitrospirae bacterium RIFOXYB2_FULL_43_5]|nr:MAG: hypothetical protein A2X54_08555 [Nitrospirae bacterium GWF2_44_13]OGW35392.1 MAG: hypothetical protein A2088_04245 [Nitrospirae bacterium GWD2_44_7]OGW63744.1 MAG: hypothetical protein A2222_08575 [Nitrospirae bacterium RIFOXYA2_FULL_44_9]OGW74194.1 MAG: hypothetical protein A3J81_03805 [Nitrospirae bacterium RIFOXYB2_FULL_43_5]
MKKIAALIISVVFSLAFSNAFAQTDEHVHKPHTHKHKEYAKVKNPIPKTEESIAKGKRLYEEHCISCHGESSRGNEKTYLTDGLWIHGDTDGEIFHVITDGTKGTAMRGFKKEITKNGRWHLVNYIKSLKKTEKE